MLRIQTTQKRKRSASFTLECPVHTKKKQATSKDKSKTFKPHVQTTRSSVTLAPVSTTNVQVLKPFWNKFTAEWSKKLWSDTKTDCVVTDSKSLNGFLPKQGRSSWFSVHQTQKKKIQPENSQMISSPSPLSLWPVIMDSAQQQIEEEDKKETMQMKAHKIRLYPTKEQKQILNQWLGACRWTYNKCVQAIQEKKVKANKKSLRSFCVNNDALIEEHKWAVNIPYDIRDEAMADVLKAMKSNTGKKYHLKFRSRKDASQSLVVLKKHWRHKNGKYSMVFGPNAIQSTEQLPECLEFDSRLIKTRLGHWYLCLPLELKTLEDENQITDGFKSDMEGIVSLDPGVRTFMTAYDSSGKVFEWGKQDIGRIYRLGLVIDKLQSKWSKKDIKHKKRYKLQKAARRIHLKIRNLIDEVHKQMAKWLSENYRAVLLPKFETSRMIRRGQRKIRSKTVRAMITWSHFRFRQRIIHKFRAFSKRHLIICDEAYTSKTCGQCGFIHNKLGGKKLFVCPRCNFTLDRDVNGARNILLRYLTLNTKEICSHEQIVGATPLVIN